MRQEGKGQPVCNTGVREGIQAIQNNCPPPKNHSAREVESKLDQCWQEDNGDSCQSPGLWPARQTEPTQQEQKKQRWFYKAAAQVIKNLPPRNYRQRVGNFFSRFVRYLRAQPFRNLPVTSYPTMFASIVGAVVRGIVLNDLDIASEAGSSVCALDQVMTEQGIARKAAIENAVKCIDLIDPFSNEDAFTVQVLIHVGGSASVNVEPRLA